MRRVRQRLPHRHAGTNSWTTDEGRKRFVERVELEFPIGVSRHNEIKLVGRGLAIDVRGRPKNRMRERSVVDFAFQMQRLHRHRPSRFFGQERA